MFTKYHQMGRALGVAVGPDSVAFFLEPSGACALRVNESTCVGKHLWSILVA